MHKSLCLLALSVAWLATHARSDVLHVPSPFATIQSAVNAALDGDVILVAAPGSYDGFTISSKSLAVIADGTVSASVTGAISIQSIDVNRSVVLARLSVTPASQGALIVSNCAGAIRIENCVFRGADQAQAAGFNGVTLASATNITFGFCEAYGGRGGRFTYHAPWGWVTDLWDGGQALRSAISTCGVFFGSYIGGNSTDYSGSNNEIIWGHPAGSGASVSGSFVFVSGASLSGGRAGSFQLLNPCFSATGSAVCGDGGHGIFLTQLPSTLYVQQPALGFGLGGAAPYCAFYVDGVNGKRFRREAGGSTAARITAISRSLFAPALVAGTNSFNVQITGDANEMVFLVDDTQAAYTYMAGYHGIWALGVPPSGGTQLGLTDASGSLVTGVTLPPLQANEPNRTVHLQAYHVHPSGNTYIGNPFTVTLVP